MNDAHVTPCYISLYWRKSICCRCLKMHPHRYVYWRYLCTTSVLLTNIQFNIHLTGITSEVRNMNPGCESWALKLNSNNTTTWLNSTSHIPQQEVIGWVFSACHLRHAWGAEVFIAITTWDDHKFNIGITWALQFGLALHGVSIVSAWSDHQTVSTLCRNHFHKCQESNVTSVAMRNS